MTLDQGNNSAAAASEPWFSKPNVDVLFYRVNRRPIGGDPSLFDPPPDLLDHLRRVLAVSAPGHSGRKYRRTWQLGSLEFDEQAGTFTGRLGWARSASVLGQVWDSETHEWRDRLVPKDDSAVAPVAFSLNGRILGVLKHPSFTTEAVLDDVLTEILNGGERQMEFPTTSWGVEPLGDQGDFYAWLDSVDQLLLLRLVFERPNPDGEPEFDALFARLDRYEADQIKEEIRARDQTSGLQKEAVKNDPTTKGFLVAALDHAFGRIWAKGKRNGRAATYDQRQRVQRLSIDDVGSDWNTATEAVLDAVSKRGLEHGKTSKRGELLDGSGTTSPL
ncbi:hypothetical protein IT072_09790 [Leifsonia sp. ZF2019]|uniref:hypothetical protein n=1 Tax=Leifsonia sp. ZF2019 TaxID=2781978 RepID=UPI001CBC40CD|nr:hypothetical protein [Leifsonia sp. ZF2019]UAJ81237.1 hypothetical protein IT072_09790 [Leifsonia sp. ZF2019]